MRYFWLLLCLIWGLALPAAAQDETDDKTYLENLLQNALSGNDHNVSITGFSGALSSQAKLKLMTISDSEGVWLTMRGATLIWSRSALLSGHLDVTELSAQEIEITRLPNTPDRLDTTKTQAGRFALPDLPVSVDVKKVELAKVILHAPVIGEPATLSALGSFTLDEGEGSANLDIKRLDRPDQISFAFGFSNATRVLALDLNLVEAEDGLISSLLNIPDAPALSLQVEGEAPISDYTARVALSSDGTRRFGGTFDISSLSEEADIGYEFGADLSGDVRPLFNSELHPFFGESSTLKMAGRQFSDGRLLLEQLDIVSGALDIRSELALAPDGWPERFALNGEIATDTPVRLPLSGSATTITSAEFAATYNATQGETWTTSAEIFGFEREGLSVRGLSVEGEGTIDARDSRKVTAQLEYQASGIGHVDEGLARAIGRRAAGSVALEWQPDTPLNIDNLLVVSGGTILRASGTVDGLNDGFTTKGEATLIANDLTRFQDLTDRKIDGTAEAQITGEMDLLGGAFDVKMRAITRDLQVDQPRLDPVLRGVSRLELDAARTPDGTVLRKLTVRNDEVQAEATGKINATAGTLELLAQLRDVSLVEPRLSGPATIDSAFAWEKGAGISISRFDASLSDAKLVADGTLNPENPDVPVEGSLTLTAPTLSRFAKLAKMPLSGAVTVALSGSGKLSDPAWDITGELKGTGVRSGIDQLDRLVAGSVDAVFSAAYGDAPFNLRYLKLTSPRLKVNASGEGPGAPVAVSARLSDLALLAPGFSGPATARGTLTPRDRDARNLSVALDATGPGGTQARITGQINSYGQSLDLNVAGTAPLGLANGFIQPRSITGLGQFDLRVQGPAQLSSVSGDATFQNARVALPTLNYSLNNLSGSARLSNGRAEVDVTGDAGTGGQFRVAGAVQLVAGFPGNLAITLSQLGLFDPTLYRTAVSGTLNVSGPLTGGALIAGNLTLGVTELRVPSGSGSITGTLPDIRHLYEPAAVRQTRKRAGLIEQMKRGRTNFPIDITINAPRRIFVRGRGLDAELGGRVRLTGTTADIRPAGVFELLRGRLDILGKRLDLTEGLIDLRGALDPYLRFVAETTVDDVSVMVIIEGLASEPNVTFTSVPDLPQEEVVARLLFGRDLASMSAFQAAQLVSAVATLSGRYQGGITGRLRDNLGLSDLDITTTQEGATQFTAGAYIADNVYSEVVADSDGKQQINLNLDVSKYVTIKGRVNNEGNTGIGVFFEKDY